jgi:protein gp37
MGNKTGIEWTDSTWSPIRFRVRKDAAAIAHAKGYTSLVTIAEKMAGRVGPHCEHVSPGCVHCYAETNNHRCLPANGTGLPYDRRSRDLLEPFIDEKILIEPLKWRPITYQLPSPCGPYVETAERPRRIFVENQSDLFGEWVTDEMLYAVLAMVYSMPQHRYQALTKRPASMLARMSSICLKRLAVTIHSLWLKAPGGDKDLLSPADFLKDIQWPLPNLWLGVSPVNQATADEYIPLLLQTPAAVRFISAEPLLGPVSLSPVADKTYQLLSNFYAPDGSFDPTGSQPTKTRMNNYVAKVDWVICGGESGPGARPMHPDWARSLRDQCQAARLPFFFKQWGESIPGEELRGGEDARERTCCLHRDGYLDMPDCCSHTYEGAKPEDGAVRTIRVGKKAAGALLDGREWREFPAQATA